MTSVPSIREQLRSVPRDPGVYLWKDAQGKVLYVGKARDLRARMLQYVNLQDGREMIPRLMATVTSFDYVTCDNDHESLILEKNLIHQFSPTFNVDFKDDKSYPFVALTMGDTYPALKYTRERHVPTTRYFGPFTDARAARTLIEVARRITPICLATCQDYRRLRRRLQAGEATADKATAATEALAANKAGVTAAADRAATATAATAATATAATAATATAATAATATAIAAGKPCFNYHVGLGPGPCSGACTPQEYAKQVERVTSFLSGQRRAFIFELEQGMAAAAAELDFEKAARIRDRIGIIRSLEDRQVVQLPSDFSADVIGFFWEESIAGVQVLSVREGLVLLANEFVLDKGQDIGESELVRGFLMRYYESASSIPTLVMLSALPEDSELIAGWLTRRLGSRHGAKVRLAVPKRGEKRELLDLAKRNAHHSLNRYKVRSRYDEERINNALLQLESALALPKPPLRIESFDISTIHGAYSVASMVVFSAGKPEKSQYRRFRIRLQTGEANDVAMMREVFQRRFAPERVQDQRFGTLPDLVIVDGGRPQLNVALQELKRLGLGLPCAGLAKSDEELFCEWSGAAPVVLPSGSAALYLVKRVRDEAHRFAISYHRELRGKSVRKSVLDDVFGLGPIRRAKLIRAFGSLKRLKAATLEEIRSVDDIPADVARAVFEQLHSDEQMKMRGV